MFHMQSDLFHRKDGEQIVPPLADRMRPLTLDDILGQDTLVGRGAAFRHLIEKNRVPSCIFWGPPGCGKTTLAEVIASASSADFVSLSAVTSGVGEIRQIVQKAHLNCSLKQRRTILFIDEIHRFNKGQQDALLPHIEKGTLIFIGATTENPSFEVNQALLSRVRVFVLNLLSEKDLISILAKSIKDKIKGLGGLNLKVSEDALSVIAGLSDGDARSALNILQLCAESLDADGNNLIDSKMIKQIVQRSQLKFDKKGEEYYNVISALHKSLRGSDADASLYWLARMLEGGQDPMYIARRLVRFASEDVGLAEPEALIQAVSAMQAVRIVGLPECKVHLAQAVVFLARARKSNALYEAYNQAAQTAQKTSSLPVPLPLRNASTQLMKKLGYGQGYKYNPHFIRPVSQDYLPDKLKGTRFLNDKI